MDNINGIPKGSYAVATKIHHAAADGMAIVNFFGGLMDIDEQGTPVMTQKERKSSNRYAKPTLLQMSVRGMSNGVRSPVKVANTLFKYAPNIVQSAKEQFMERHKQVKSSIPSTRFNLETSPHRVFDSTTFELNDLRAIRGAVRGSTVNDMVLAVCSGALRKYLGHHKELPAQSLSAFVPVNVRGSNTSGAHQPSNKISTMAPKIFTNIKDPVERLTAIHAETKEQKAARKGISARLMTDVTRHIPASTQLLAARLIMGSEMAGGMTNLCISNVPGPQVPLFMNGAKVVRQMGLGPLADRMGLFIAVSSYNGEIAFSATSCRRTLPDIEFFMECIRVSFYELKSACLEFNATKQKEEAADKALAEQEEKKKKRTAKKKTKKKASKKINSKKVTKKVTKKAAKKTTKP